MKKLIIAFLPLLASGQVTTPLTVFPGATTDPGEIRLRETRSNGSNWVAIKSPSSVASDLAWTLPPTDGTLGQALVTNGAGALSWSSVSATSFPVCNSTTGNDTYTCTVSGFTAYSAGYCIVLYADTANTGTATVNISAVGAKSILRYGGSALSNSDILANTPVMICYDGTQFTLPPSASPGSGAFLDGGNSFGATATLGTNDNYDLRLERNNTTLMTLGSGGIDMAPAVSNFYAKVRKLEIADAALGSAFWDVTASASVGSSEYRTRDNAGSRWIVGYRTFSGSPANYAHVFTDWLPAKRDTTDGDALTDSDYPSLGSTGRRWLKVWTDSAEITNGITVGTTGTFGGNVTLNGTTNTMTGTMRPGFTNTGSIGDSSYRYANVYAVGVNTEGLTIATGAVNNYVWTTNGSGVGSWQATQACATCFVNGGNSFGAAATLGTNDANILNFETDNTARWRITAAGMMQPVAADTYDIGDLSSARVRGVYAQIVDTAKSGGTGDFVKSRLFRVVDAAGGAGYWDVTANAAAGLSNIGAKDNSGSRLFVGWRANGSAVNYTRWYSSLLPAKRDTLDGDATTDLLFPELGASTARWSTAYIGGLDIDGSVIGDLVPFGNNTYDLGESAYRWKKLWSVSGDVSGTLTVGTATNTVALTASGATYLQTTGIGEASPAKGLLSVFGHNGYAYTPYNIVVGARFRTGANSALLFGTTIANTSGWTRGMYWGYQSEDLAFTRFKDDETSAPINDLYISAGGLVGIGTAAVTEELTVNGSIDVIGSGAIEIAGTTVIDASRNATVANLTITGTCTGCSGLPATDTSAIVKGSADATKLLRFEVDGFTTATTRILTPQNASYTIAGTDIGQTFTGAQTFNNTVNLNNGFSTDSNVILTSTRVLSNIASVTQSWVPTTNNLYSIGSSGTRWANLYAVSLDISSTGSISGNLTMGGSTNTMSGTMRPGFDGLGSIGDATYKYGSVRAYDIIAASNLWLGSSVILNSSRVMSNVAYINQDWLPYDVFQDLGSSSLPWQQIHGSNYYAGGVAFVDSSRNGNFGTGYFSGSVTMPSATMSGNMIPSLGGGGSIGTGAVPYGSVYANNVYANNSFTMQSGSNSTIYVGTGNFYMRSFSGADANCSGVTDGWAGIRTDTTELQVCIGGATKKASLL